MERKFRYPHFVSYAVGDFDSRHSDPWFAGTAEVLNFPKERQRLITEPSCVDVAREWLAKPTTKDSPCPYCESELISTEQDIGSTSKQHYRPIPEAEIHDRIATVLHC